MFWWTSRSAPDWLQEMNSNLAQHVAPGATLILDLTVTVLWAGAHGAPLISLQTTMSLFRDDARFYNSVTYLVFCGACLALWVVAVLRSHSAATSLMDSPRERSTSFYAARISPTAGHPDPPP